MLKHKNHRNYDLICKMADDLYEDYFILESEFLFYKPKLNKEKIKEYETKINDLKNNYLKFINVYLKNIEEI